MAAIDTGSDSVGKANVNSNFELEVHTPTIESRAGFVQISSEVDDGALVGTRYVLAPETDTDYRLRTSVDQLLDTELFTYAVQNTSKFAFAFTTLTCTSSVNGVRTNSGNITTTTTGCTFGTFAMFPFNGTAPLHCEMSVSFSAQPQSNTIIDFGMFQRGASTAFAPLDGAYFRLTEAGLFGVTNNSGTETVVGPFPLADGTGTWVYTNDSVNRFLIQISNVDTTFWINNELAGRIPNPVGVSQPFRSAALPWSFRHAIVGGAAGGVINASFWDYRVGFRGPLVADQLGAIGNRMWGSYQGLSGNAIGSLSNYTNNAAPAAAVPTNTTAALGTGLGGVFGETFSLAVNTDGIICSFQNPAGSTTVQGRRLRIQGVRIEGFVSTVLAGGPSNAIWTLNFGHTAVSLATGESASFANGTTKAPRRIPLGQQAVGAAQAVNTTFSVIDVKFQEPVYVNPGEFVAVSKKYFGTVGTSGTIQNIITLDYGWE